ncbi:MAG TPA: hypothetical protein VFW66_07480 [Gemmatimonadales bacterium]|nr:hypothetical protein [Gemmatimonadales bacterium]
MTGRPEDLPPAVRGVDEALHRVHFEPRASLGPEVLGRLRRGEQSKGAVPLRFSRPALLLTGGFAALAAGVGGALAVHQPPDPPIAFMATGGGSSTAARPVEATVDHCCFDLDGGGRADDGIAIKVNRAQQAAIREIQVYEDRDHTRTFSKADVVRFIRGPRLIVDSPLPAGLRTRRYCCADYDGEGMSDDGLLVVARPPDRVVLVGLYSSPAGAAGTKITGRAGLPLR